MKLTISLLGNPEINIDGQPIEIRRRKSLALVAYVALAKKAISRDKLAELLWANSDIKNARTSLRTALYELTSSYDLEWLEIDNNQVSVNDEVVDIDTEIFTAYIAQVEQHQHLNQQLCDDCLVVLHQAEKLYQDGFLTNFEISGSPDFDYWLTIQTSIFQREYEAIISKLAAHYKLAGNIDKAIHYATRWLSVDPLHESVHRLLMELYAFKGERNKALLQYQTCVDILDEELAAPPTDETVSLYERIRDGQVIDKPVQESVNTIYSVLPTLPSLVIGREQALRDLKQRLGINGERRATVVIQGLPGVGKSTIAAALAHDNVLRTVFPDGIFMDFPW